MSSARSWLVAAGLAAALVAEGAAWADESAEAFVQIHASEALDILNDGELSLEDKAEEFRIFVEEVADVPRITRFVLGRYARGADPTEYASFAEAFREYAIGEYETRLSEYSGQVLTVTGSTDRSPTDVIVHSEISGGPDGEVLPVNWRIYGEGESRRVVDVEVFGVWLALNQREQISSIISEAGGRLSAATEALERLVAEQSAGG